MRSVLAGIRTLVLPWGASTTSPRLVLGPDIPPELVTYFATYMGGNYEVISVILWYWDGGDQYFFEALLNTHPAESITNGHVFGMKFADGSVHTHILFDQSNLQFSPISTETLVPQVSFGDVLASGIVAPQGLYVLPSFDFNIDLRSQGRGLKARVDTTTSSGAIGAETIVLTTPSVTFQAGRAYAVKVGMQITNSAASICNIRARKTNLAGTNYATWRLQNSIAAGQNITHQAYMERTGSDTSFATVISLTASAGTVTMFCAADLVAYAEIWDVGDAGDYGNAFAL